MNSKYIAAPEEKVLVTGPNGFIGPKVVECLLEYGFTNIRCFVRPSSDVKRLREVLDRFALGKNVEIVTGDLLSRDDCRRAAEGVSVIYHLATSAEKSFAGAFMNSALVTRNLVGRISGSRAPEAVRECQLVCRLFEPELKAGNSPG